MIRIKHAILLAAAAVGLPGCATVMHGANQTYLIDTDPVGASVKMSNGSNCVSPCKLELPRRYDFRADISLDGYRPVYVLVHSKTGGATFGNLLAGGIIGAVVDSSNGANKQLSPNPLKVRLTAVGQTTAEVLLDKKGKETGTVEAYNDKVRVDIAKSLGPDLAGLPAPAPAAGGN